MALIYCTDCGTDVSDKATSCPKCGYPFHHLLPGAQKNKTLVIILALFLGGLGIHKFYLGRTMWGIVYLVFCWTFIPALVAFVEGLIYLFQSQAEFDMKYNS